MKKYNLLFLIILFLGAANAQDTLLIEEPTSLSYYSFDQKVDKGFAPTSNFIQSIIFYSFKVQNKKDYYELKTLEKFS